MAFPHQRSAPDSSDCASWGAPHLQPRFTASTGMCDTSGESHRLDDARKGGIPLTDVAGQKRQAFSGTRHHLTGHQDSPGDFKAATCDEIGRPPRTVDVTSSTHPPTRTSHTSRESVHGEGAKWCNANVDHHGTLGGSLCEQE